MVKIKADIPKDYSERILRLRERLSLTQMRLADMMGVSFASVNRWENGQARPSALAWQQLLRAEMEGVEAFGRDYKSALTTASNTLAPEEAHSAIVTDFTADPETVRAVAEGERLAAGHLFNPSFAVETSLIQPLPHQRLAVYKHMLPQPRLRFLLADDAGAGKTIMTGLYIREMMARRLLTRVLVVCPAGLLANWQREMRVLFGLSFQIVTGANVKAANPFVGPNSDLTIVSMDTLAGNRTFARLQEEAVAPYELVVCDEAHKLSAYQNQDSSLSRTVRYRLAEALAGVPTEDPEWKLSWSARHLLLLSATPHMGKDFPYYSLWKLLEPEALSTEYAFKNYPTEARNAHFLRRTKEEMVHFDGRPLYPERISDTLSYDLSPDEQELYDLTTDYIETYYNRAATLNRSAVRLAMSVFQRRLASSTYALLRSFEKRLAKLDSLIEAVKQGEMKVSALAERPRDLKEIEKTLEVKTADEEAGEDGREEHEVAEERAMEGVAARSLEELCEEREQVYVLLHKAQKVYERGEESKFDKLRDVLTHDDFKNEKLIIFTEHRDTMMFLVRRLEGMGFAGQVASIHGGMDFREREIEIERFRKPVNDGGATYLVATDAAGEGINLQFAWLMLNYDIPWNPARLEQRMGRIHRYGQKRDRVIVLNLVAGKTREGRVLKTLLDKLERICKELRSDKVFDVVGRVFEGVSLRDYLQQAITEEGANQAVNNIEGILTESQVRALEEKEKALYGDGGEVMRALPELRIDMEQEVYRRLLPGYVRRFIERAAPLLGIGIDGDINDDESGFGLRSLEKGALDAILPLLETYFANGETRFTLRNPNDARTLSAFNDTENIIFLHPGEPLFERFRSLVAFRLGRKALRGAVFADPSAERPYLFHLARVTVKRLADPTIPGLEREQTLVSRLVGLRQEHGGPLVECPIESLLLLSDAPMSPALDGSPQRLSNLTPEARRLIVGVRDEINTAHVFAVDSVTRALAEQKQHEIRSTLPQREDFVRRGFAYQEVELANRRTKTTQKAASGDDQAKEQVKTIKARQRALEGERELALARLQREADLIAPSDVEFLAHALVIPTDEPVGKMRRDMEIEGEAMRRAIAYEEARGSSVQDVSTPERARSAGLSDYPGFDLLSTPPVDLRSRFDVDILPEERCIEVKGRADFGEVLLTENEWARACNLRDRYWLYVVYGCASARPRLLTIRDPFRLLVNTRMSVVISEREIIMAAEPNH